MTVGRADVYVGDVLAGTLTQTLEASTFAYRGDFAGTGLPGRGIALHLPRDEGPFIVPGTYLPPFFANLLPEGFRLEALRSRMRVAADDAFSILLRVGADTIGDVSVVPEGERPAATKAKFSLNEVAELDLLALLEEDLDAHASVPGVQEKLSSRVVSFPVRAGAEAAILKLSPPAYPRLVENEHFFMQMGAACGLEVAETRIVHDREGRSGLVVRRFDRNGATKRHQEDGCQLLNIHPGSKYSVPLRALAEAVRDRTTAGPVQMRKLLRLFAFAYVVGNGDLHAKNVSVYVGPRGFLEVTPAYDLLSTLPYPKLERRMALPMDGRDDKWRRRDFLTFFGRLGLPERAANAILDEVYEASEAWTERVEEIGFDAKTTERLAHALTQRRGHLAA